MSTPKKKFNPALIDITLDDFRSKFAHNERRRELLENLLSWNRKFEESGFRKYIQWVGGSYVTDKKNPNDIDVITIYLRPSMLREEKDMEEFKNKNKIAFDRSTILKLFSVDNIILEGGLPLIVQAKEIAYWVTFFSHDRNDINGKMRTMYQICDIGILSI